MTTDAPLVSFVFLDVTDVDGARAFFEDALGLPVAEDRFRPPHHIHGLVKYDAGTTLLSLNKARRGYDRTAHDGVRVGLATRRPGWRHAAALSPWIAGVDGSRVNSVDNHRFEVAVGEAAAVPWLEFATADPAASGAFFNHALGLAVTQAGDTQTAPTRTMTWRFRADAAARAHRRTGLFLTVLHSADLDADMARLSAGGVRFLSAAQDSQIGRTVRFACPDGHHFCLYQPSDESMGWESGPVLRRLIDGGGTVAA